MSAGTAHHPSFESLDLANSLPLMLTSRRSLFTSRVPLLPPDRKRCVRRREGTAVSYDANGNTSVYDPDGASGVKTSRTLIYDLENRPLFQLSNGAATIFAYGPGAFRANSTCRSRRRVIDGERTLKKASSGAVTQYLGNDAGWNVTSGMLTAYLHPDVMLEKAGSGNTV
jgi:hypothetical protein